MLSLYLFFIGLAAGANLSRHSTSETRTLDQIYEAAQSENGTLQVYFGGSCKYSRILVLRLRKRSTLNPCKHKLRHYL